MFGLQQILNVLTVSHLLHSLERITNYWNRHKRRKDGFDYRADSLLAETLHGKNAGVYEASAVRSGRS